MDNNQPTNNLNMNSDMNTAPSSTPVAQPKHKGHGGLIAAIVIVMVAVIVAVLLINNGDQAVLNNMVNEQINQAPEDTVILDENAPDDLSSIEADLESLDIENLDSGLE